MSVADKIERIVAEFAALPEWEDRYKRIIALAKQLPPMPADLHTEERKVRGCASDVWLHATREDDHIVFLADSNAAITKGLVALVVGVYSGERAEEILATPPTFIERLGLNANLSPNRANGLVAMVTSVKRHALDALMAYKRERPTEITPLRNQAISDAAPLKRPI